MQSLQTGRLALAVVFLFSLPAAAAVGHEPDQPRRRPNSILLPAYAFDRGNVLVMESGGYADTEPVIVNNGVAPNQAEYDFDVPVSATYTLHVRYAAHAVRPVDVFFDGTKFAQAFVSQTGSWQSSSAKWERVGDVRLATGKHTLRLVCPGPCIPHIVALRLDSSEPFPKGWKLVRPNARKLGDILGAVQGHRKDKDGFEAFVHDDGHVDVPDDYNPIVHFEKRPPPEPNAHRILEYTLMGSKYQVSATVVQNDEPVDPDDSGWSARLAVNLGKRTETAVLPLSEKQLQKMLDHAVVLADDFGRQHSGGTVTVGLEPERRRAAELKEQAAALHAQPDNADRWRRFYELYVGAYQLKNRVALANPLLAFHKLVFAKRFTYDTSHIYTTYFDGSHRFGGNLYVLAQLKPTAVPTKLVAPLGDTGIYRDPDVSWDGTRVLFSFKKDAGAPCHIYEIGLDGSGLRQLTNSEYDDVDPAYLPDGRIVFISTRSRRVVLCHNAFTVSVLHTMNADGSDLRCVSTNTVNEFTPSVAADGHLLYTRWEYIDKNVGNNQSLWRARPDGTFASHVAGAHWGPITFWEPRQIPGSDLVVCTLAPHMPIASGPIALVDPHEVCRSPAGYVNLTPELPPPHHFAWHRTDVGYYCNPYPLSESYFIVSYSFEADPRAATGYGLYLLDKWGNRDLLYRDPEISCFEAMPAVSRPLPPAITPTPASDEPTGTFVVLDIYQGMPGVPRGAVKYLRVIEEVPKPVSAECRGFGLQHPLISNNGNFAVKRLLGTVPVEPDGSVHFNVPANKAVYFSALDEDHLELQRMRSFVHAAPGQTITCVGCHEDRRTAPPTGMVQALARPASKIESPPGGPHAPDFYYDVQPVLNQYCVRCHGGERTDGGVDLAADHTNLFNVAYETLTAGYVSYVNIYSSATLALRPPKYYGSHASKLIGVLRGEHKKHVDVPKDALRQIATWIDCNAPYYGTYQYDRPGTIGGRELVDGPVKTALEDVFRRRCTSCHAGDTNRVRHIRYPSVEGSRSLLAPLAKAAGGTERCGKPIFADKLDPDYRKMVDGLKLLDREVKRNPRVDMLVERPPLIDDSAPYRFR
jgi:cytochrome c553